MLTAISNKYTAEFFIRTEIRTLLKHKSYVLLTPS